MVIFLNLLYFYLHCLFLLIRIHIMPLEYMQSYGSPHFDHYEPTIYLFVTAHLLDEVQVSGIIFKLLSFRNKNISISTAIPQTTLFVYELSNLYCSHYDIPSSFESAIKLLLFCLHTVLVCGIILYLLTCPKTHC